jgi:two-component system, OmpR family, phosphate regulon sensor histidine kinase PhoR
MSNKTIRMIIMLGAFIIVGIFTVQVYWLEKAFSVQDRQFEQSVRINLSHVSEALNDEKADQEQSFRSIEQVSSNYYVLHVNGKIDTSFLSNLLKKEFSTTNYKTDAEYAIYDSSTHKMLYGDFIARGNGGRNELENKNLPSLNNGDYYIGISFPGIIFRMTGEMYIWIFSTFILLIFLVFFCYALFVILRQKRLSEVQRDFVNNMTHEFKTPLSTISLAAETLGSYPENQRPQLSAFLNMIKLESAKLNTQVDKILLSGKSGFLLNLKKERLDLHQLIRETAENLKSSFKKNIQLIYNLKAEQPLVIADKIYTIHTLQNLLDNAIKYSGDNPEVVICTENRNGKLVLSIEDNGTGIESRYSKKIFEPFFRIPTDNLHNVRGFGIGLHYVMNIVRAHRWKLFLSSEQKKGSKFTLQIPA